jgi:DNA-directed RNA polymerase subunit E'
MYNVVTVKDTIRIPPKLFSKNLKKSVQKALMENYEGRLDDKLGVVISVFNPRDVSDGRIIAGDGAAYHDVVFDALVFRPELHEVIRGEISDITEFGAFIKFGPIDGLVHVSQVTDDFVSYNEKGKQLVGKESKRSLKVGDEVLARIIALSLKVSVADSKINLTMRQTGLGRENWTKKRRK